MGLASATDKRRSAPQRRCLRACCALLLLAFASLCAGFRAAAAPLEASDYKMAGDATKMRIVMQFRPRARPKWFLLRGPQPAGHRPAAKPNSPIDAKELKARGLVRSVRYGDARRGHIAADPDRQGAVRRRQARRAQERGRQRLPLAVDMSAASRPRVRRSACRPGADHRLDGVDRQGRPGRHRAGRRSGQALHRRHRSRPWRHRRRRRRPQRHGREERHAGLRRANCATSSPRSANTTSS